jgi:hypothetical protein
MSGPLVSQNSNQVYTTRYLRSSAVRRIPNSHVVGIHFRLEWISNILVVVSAGLFVAFGAGARSDSGRSAAAVGIVFVVVLEVGHR